MDTPAEIAFLKKEESLKYVLYRALDESMHTQYLVAEVVLLLAEVAEPR
jgi:hypothetical protein